MINIKLDLTNLITTMNEVEKLKRLLFDKDQYLIFEHIPKPFLIDSDLIEPHSPSKGTSLKGRASHSSRILIANNALWKTRVVGEQQKMDDFETALDNIKKKGELNIIDKRLLSIIDGMGG